VTLSALVLGPILTVVPLHQYFSDPLFLSYFGNIIGHVQFSLPGVFTAVPMQGIVNLNLWTLTPEYYCYAFIFILMLSGALFDRLKLTVIAGIMFAILGLGNSFLHLGESDTMYGAPALLMSFVAGACAYSWREHIVIRDVCFALAVITLYSAYILHCLPWHAFAAASQVALARRLFIRNLPLRISHSADARRSFSDVESMVGAVSGSRLDRHSSCHGVVALH